jgi:hypothetical protein
MLLTKIEAATAVMVAVGAATLACGMMAEVKAGEKGRGSEAAPVAVREDKPGVPASPEPPKGEYNELRGRWRVVWENLGQVCGKGKGKRGKDEPMVWTLKGVPSPETTKAGGAGDAVYFQLSPKAKRPSKDEVASFNLLVPYTLDPPDPRLTNMWVTMEGVYGWVGEDRIRLCIPLSQGYGPTKLPTKLVDRGTKGYVVCELERVK